MWSVLASDQWAEYVGSLYHLISYSHENRIKKILKPQQPGGYVYSKPSAASKFEKKRDEATPLEFEASIRVPSLIGVMFLRCKLKQRNHIPRVSGCFFVAVSGYFHRSNGVCTLLVVDGHFEMWNMINGNRHWK